MTTKAGNWEKRVEQVTRPIFHDRVMLCAKCNEMEVAKAGEFTRVFHDCGEIMEPLDCAKCDQPATRIVNCGQQRQGYPACVETWITIEEPRCEAHWRR